MSIGVSSFLPILIISWKKAIIREKQIIIIELFPGKLKAYEYATLSPKSTCQIGGHTQCFIYIFLRLF